MVLTMGEGSHTTAGTLAESLRDASLEALSAEAWQLEPPMPHERRAVLREEAALLIDRLLARVARGRGALEVASGELLCALAEGDTPGECLAQVAQHFIETWGEAPAERSSPSKKVLARDGGLCQVPGCSRAAVHAHHVRYRSQGGGDEPENEVGVCAAHHLHCIHRGWVRVRGTAPHGLIWELGARPRVESLWA
jgi:hypothetical protein